MSIQSSLAGATNQIIGSVATAQLRKKNARIEQQKALQAENAKIKTATMDDNTARIISSANEISLENEMSITAPPMDMAKGAKAIQRANDIAEQKKHQEQLRQEQHELWKRNLKRGL